MRKFGLIGFPLSHTFSPPYFKEKFKTEGIIDADYQAYPLENIDLFGNLLDDQFIGLNVTIPYKQSILNFLHELDPVAREIGAVNTIKQVNGKLIGYNTDAYGFEVSLTDFLGNEKIKKALILGTGGAAKAVEYVLEKLKIKFTYVSRKSPYLTYPEIDKKIIASHQLIINTTPLGMAPNINNCPTLPYRYISEKHFLYDLVYNPEKTLFLKNGSARGAQIKNGKDMLHLQAEKSWEIWNHH